MNDAIEGSLPRLQVSPRPPSRSTAGPAPAWHTLTVAAVLDRLATTEGGLSGAEAARAAGRARAERARGGAPDLALGILLAQFKNVLILILLVAVGLSALLGHVLEAVVIAVIVLFAVLLGFVQEYRAERAIEALRRMAAPWPPCCAMVRSGRSRRARWCRATSFSWKRATACPPTPGSSRPST